MNHARAILQVWKGSVAHGIAKHVMRIYEYEGHPSSISVAHTFLFPLDVILWKYFCAWLAICVGVRLGT